MLITLTLKAPPSRLVNFCCTPISTIGDLCETRHIRQHDFCRLSLFAEKRVYKEVLAPLAVSQFIPKRGTLNLRYVIKIYAAYLSNAHNTNIMVAPWTPFLKVQSAQTVDLFFGAQDTIFKCPSFFQFICYDNF